MKLFILLLALTSTLTAETKLLVALFKGEQPRTDDIYIVRLTGKKALNPTSQKLIQSILHFSAEKIHSPTQNPTYHLSIELNSETLNIDSDIGFNSLDELPKELFNNILSPLGYTKNKSPDPQPQQPKTPLTIQWKGVKTIDIATTKNLKLTPNQSITLSQKTISHALSAIPSTNTPQPKTKVEYLIELSSQTTKDKITIKATLPTSKTPTSLLPHTLPQ